MILEKYDFNSVHEFLSELIKGINNKGELHLTTVLVDASGGQLSLVGTNHNLMVNSLNHALKRLISLNLDAGDKPNMDAIATVMRNDKESENSPEEFIKKIEATTNLQELLNLFMTKH